ncbi:MAG: hypothetical protein P8Y70_18185 [Candidatus Lokiarchaeota archaeon]
MIVSGKRISEQIKIDVKNVHRCPICGEAFRISIEREEYLNLIDEACYPYPHLHLHGNPLHAMICYIDSHLTVRSIECVKSVEIFRNSMTFTEIAKKWANPF